MPPAVCGLSAGFPAVSPTAGQVPHVLLTRPPLSLPKKGPSDLHVLGAPPAFVLSQDQTLHHRPAGAPARVGASLPSCSVLKPTSTLALEHCTVPTGSSRSAYLALQLLMCLHPEGA